MKHNSFYQLFVEQLQDIYNAETQIVHALPRLIEAASLPELKETFQGHLKDTQRQVQRLKKIFTHLGVSHKGKTCKGMEGLLKEGQEVIAKIPSSALRDAALISAAQKVEHYEIAGYGIARAYAKHLELGQFADVLQDSLDEEASADKKLTRLAEGSFFNRGINEEARKEEAGLNASALREMNKKLESSEEKSSKVKRKTARKTKKKAAVKTAKAKKATSRKTTAKKTTARKSTKRVVGKKTTSRKKAVKKTTARKATKRTVGKKAVTGRKVASKRTSKRKSAKKTSILNITRSPSKSNRTSRPSLGAFFGGGRSRSSHVARSASRSSRSSRVGMQAKGR